MAGSATVLKQLHHLRRHSKELRDQIERGPTVLKNQQSKVAKQEQALHDAQDKLKRQKVDIHSKEVTLKEKAQAIDKHAMQMNSASSKKEYDALKNEIATDRDASKRLEDEILTLMMEVDEHLSTIPGLEQALKKAKEEFSQFEKSHATRLADLATELARVTDELKTVEATLSDEIRPTYDRLMNAKGEDALSAVHGRTCTACYTEITAQNYNDLMVGQFLICKNCGRFLYLAD